MTTKSEKHSERDRIIATEAARWHETLRSEDAAQSQEFTAWLAQSPVHVREFLLSHALDEALSRFDLDRKIPVSQRAPASNVIKLDARGAFESDAPSEPRERTSGNNRVRAWALILAASVATIYAGLAYFNLNAGAKVYETGVGEQLTVALTDRSLITLNAKTRLEVKMQAHQRELHLLAGQAMFSVAHDANRPFLVYVDDTQVRAVGTKFDIRRAADRAVVSVMEGRVQIKQPSAVSEPSSVEETKTGAAYLAPGQGITIFHDGKMTAPKPVDVAAVTAWQQRRLIFEERTLAEIAEQFDAYNASPKLIVEGAELAARLYTGSFNANRPDTFIDYLARDPTIKIVRSADRVIVRPAESR